MLLVKTSHMIPRDGNCTSLWQDSIDPYQTMHKADPTVTYDVAIIGAGITGLSTAWALQKAGKTCIVIEARNIGFGTSGGTTAHLNTLMDTPYATIAKNFNQQAADLVAAAAKQAIDTIKQNIDELAIDCDFKELPGFLFAQNEEENKVLDEIVTSAQEAGVAVEYTQRTPVPITHTKAARFDNQAQFHPLRYIYGLAKAFEEKGGVIVEQTRVIGVDGDDVVEISTQNQSYHAQIVVFATHIPIGINLLHLRCAPYRSYAMSVKLKHDQDYPTGLAYDCQDPYHYYRSQEVDGQTYLIGGGYDHRTAEETNTEKCFLQLEAHLRKHFDVEQVMYAWSSQYFEPADGLPYIGRLPGHGANVLVATGFGGNGMIYGTVSSFVLHDVILGIENPYADLFNPNRVKPVAGFVNFIKHNAAVAGELISKLVPADKLNELADMAPGEGKVVKYENHTLALHKDDNGNLHALHSECTHMKCTIAWNTAEGSWDCPCHGARFGVDGAVLTGPAARDLTPVNIVTANDA